MARSTARQGRQPSTGSASTSSGKKPKAKPTKKSAKKLVMLGGEDDDARRKALDLYSYSSSIKRARGDVDPESRASFGKKSKGKGKALREDGADGGDGEDDSEVDEQAMFRGEEIVEFTGVRPEGLWMGGGDDDDAFDDEDDEDINSDDAFEEEDDKPRAASSKKSAKSSKQVAVEIDLDEDEIDYDDEAGGAYMDASEMLDAGDYDSEEDSEVSEDEPRLKRVEEESEISVSEEEDDAEEDDDDSESEVDEEYEGALLKLSSFVDGLESKKRKADDVVDDGGKKKKRVVLKERTQAFAEGEFVAINAADGVQQDKVNLDDLLASFATSKNPKLAALRKTLKPLAAASSTSTKSTSLSHLKASGPLAAPLPARLQDKIEREAGYEKTKEETDKWNATVRRMKGETGVGVEGARHERLTLPLMGGAGNVLRDANASEWSAKFQPTNDMENSIQSLLLAGQMSTSDLQRAEAQALAALDPADVLARQAELRQQRDLMFRAERKAKRVSKIKSKAFRRIHRKEKGHAGLSLEDMEGMDKLDGGERVTEEKARMEMTRARERVSLKHSTKGGRWSKTVGGIEGLDEERNTAVREMVARGEQLRKRIIGVDGANSADEFASESEEDDQEASFDQIRNTAFDELASLDRKEAEARALDGPTKSKSVMNMKFMKDALSREQRKVQGSADELRRKLEGMDEAAESMEVDEEMDDNGGMSEQVQGNLGRMVFGPSGTQAAAPLPILAPTPQQTTTKLSGPLAIASRSLSRSSPLSLGGPVVTDPSSNPWLALDEDQPSGGKVSRKMNKATVSKDSRDSARSAAKIQRHKSKMADVREAEQDDALVEIDPSIVLAGAKAPMAPQIGRPTPKSKPTKQVANSKSTLEEDGIDSSDEEDDDTQVAAQRGQGPTAFKQRDLVARAFAGDNVVADFEAEKRKEIERDAPKEQDDTLPGWGNWGGKGVKKGKNAKKFITKIAGIIPTARKDAVFSNVIISEKKDKKASKYQLKDLPYPYTSVAQFESKLSTPLGPEWSTGTVLRDQTMPKILIKPGVTIRPLGHRDA